VNPAIVAAADPFPFEAAHRLARVPNDARWLVRDLWADQAVGIVGGEPKCCKSFLALDLAVAVASGTPALRRFPVERAGRVVIFPAEDSHDILRRRLEGISAAAGVDLAGLDLQVITAPVLRIDLALDRQRLERTLDRLRPRLLILDPFVRLHRIDENVSSEVAPLLAFLRELQRSFGLSVLLVHHSKKGGSHLRAGQALRGSSELHAWGDSNLYLRRSEERILLSTEHRAAPGQADIALQLREKNEGLALHTLEPAGPTLDGDPKRSPADRIEEALAGLNQPVSATQLREACRLRTATLTEALVRLVEQRKVEKTPAGYRLATV
jgi:RecA-family ATPase